MLKIIKSGFYSSIQDGGRFCFRNYGVPVSGFMDAYSARYANMILGNSETATLIEMTMVGGTFHFTKPCFIAITGANMSPKLNGITVKQQAVIKINENDRLSFDKASEGFRTYLAIKDGFIAHKVLGSTCQLKSITKAFRLIDNDELDYKSNSSRVLELNSTVKYNRKVINNSTLEVFKGPEFRSLKAQEIEKILKSEFKISKNNDRMAYQLMPPIKNNLKPILTAPVLPGTVQLTPSGQLIILMRDCQTTGGYPRVLQLNEDAINCLSQKTVNQYITFKVIPLS